MSYYNKKKDFTVYKSNDKYSKMIIDFTEGIDDNNSDIDNKSFNFQQVAIVVMHQVFYEIVFALFLISKK